MSEITERLAALESAQQEQQLGGIKQARIFLNAGVVMFLLLVFSAWFCALLHDNAKAATLSEMVRDWQTSEGVVFMAGMVVPAIAWLVSKFPFVLDNAHVKGAPHDEFFQYLRVLGMLCFLIVGLVPTIEQKVNTFAIEHLTFQVRAMLHMIAISFAFGVFCFAELFVLSYHQKLSKEERWFRRIAFGLMTAAILEFPVHRLMMQPIIHYFDPNNQDLNEGWCFRYEMLIGAGFTWQCQLISYYSTPSERPNSSWLIMDSKWPLPHILVTVALVVDFVYRDHFEHGVAFTWLLPEICIFAMIFFLAFQCTRDPL